METKRIALYDYIKGILMLGIVFGHFLNAFSSVSNQSSVLHLLVRTFDLPMYMLLGGVLLNKTIGKYTLSQFIVRKISKVARPTIVLGSILGIITYTVLGSFQLLKLLQYIFGIWFMWSFFISTIIVCIVTKLIKRPILQITVFCIIQLSLHLISYNLFNLNFMFPFFVLGFYLPAINLFFKKNQETKVKDCRLICVSFVLFIILFSFWNSSYMIWESDGLLLQDTIQKSLVAVYRFCIGIFGSICAFYVMKTLYSVLDKKINSTVLKIGKESMSIYIIHSFLVSQCFSSALKIICGRTALIRNFITSNWRFVILFVAPILSILTCLIIQKFVELIKKNRMVSKIVYGV